MVNKELKIFHGLQHTEKIEYIQSWIIKNYSFEDDDYDQFALIYENIKQERNDQFYLCEWDIEIYYEKIIDYEKIMFDEEIINVKDPILLIKETLIKNIVENNKKITKDIELEELKEYWEISARSMDELFRLFGEENKDIKKYI